MQGGQTACQISHDGGHLKCRLGFDHVVRKLSRGSRFGEGRTATSNNVFTSYAKAKRGLNYANPLCILMALFKAFSNERPADR